MIIRPAGHDDAAAIAHVHIAGWRASYGGLVDQDYLDGLDVTERTKNWQDIFAKNETDTLVACDAAGAIYGFTSFGKLRTPPPGMSPIRPLYASELYAIYILPDYWRQGSGRQLMSASVKMLQQKKFKSLCLWTPEKNTRGVAFYKNLGGERCGKKEIEIGPSKLREICFGWRDSTLLIVD